MGVLSPKRLQKGVKYPQKTSNGQRQQQKTGLLSRGAQPVSLRQNERISRLCS